MIISDLEPKPTHSTRFTLSEQRNIPEISGCYVLVSSYDLILYVGRTNNIRRRFTEHLESEEKRKSTEDGRAVKFYWLENDTIERIEQAWMNEHLNNEGELPILNKIYSSSQSR